MKITLKIILFLLLTVRAAANVVGTDIQNFNPTTNGLDFVTVQSSETLEPGIINIGFFLNYAINSMPNFESTTTGSRTKFDDSLLGGDINIGMGISENWDWGLSVPQVFAQESDDSQNVYRGEISQEGMTEFRVNTKYRMWGDVKGGGAVIASANFDQVKNNPFVGQDPGPTFNLELAFDTTFDKTAFGFNMGYRFRDPGSQTVAEIEPFGDQYIASTALSYLMTSLDTKLIAEVYASVPVEKPKQTTDRDVSTAEFLLGTKTDVSSSIAFHFGFGTEIYQGSSSPDWRVYSGLNWALGPIWEKKKVAPKPKVESSSVESETLALEDLPRDYLETKKVLTYEKFTAGDVLFDYNSDKLTPAFELVLLRLSVYLKRPPAVKSIKVSGHTDSVGPAWYNLDLSKRRAVSVLRNLLNIGKIPRELMSGVGYGESRPLADNGNFQGRKNNRRVEIEIVRVAGGDADVGQESELLDKPVKKKTGRKKNKARTNPR